jgi:hypothetical protein
VIAEQSLRRAVELKQRLTFRLLDDGCRQLLTGRVVQLVGRRLIAEVSEHLKPGTCLRIDCEDAFVLGETLGCWSEQSATFAVVKTFAAVELLHALTGLEELTRRLTASGAKTRQSEVPN